MSYYHITDLEKLSGIKAHTIRIWEKRYNIIQPHRTETNIRQYDDEQLKKLLNVSTLIVNGYKISTIAKLSKTALHEEISKLSVNNINGIEAVLNELTIAMLSYDEINFEKTISNAVLKFGFLDTMLGVVYPFLQKVGLLWSIDNAMPAQEHFTSHLIKQKLLSAIDALPHADSKEKYLLFLPENEFHEIGLLFSNYILRAKGIKTIYLGASVPAENIATCLKQIKPTHILNMMISNISADLFNHKELFEAAQNEGVTWLMAGRKDIIEPFTKSHHVRFLNSPKEL